MKYFIPLLFICSFAKGQYAGSTNISLYLHKSDLPSSANTGQFAFCFDTKPLYYFDSTKWVSINDSATTIGNTLKSISTNNYNNVIRVTGTSQQLDTGKIYTPLALTLTTFTLPANPVAPNNQLITINGYGLGGYKIATNTGQQIFSINGVTTLTTGYCQSTSRYTTVTLRYIATNIWLLTTLQGALLFY